MKSPLNYGPTIFRLALTCCLSTTMISSCKYFERFTKKEQDSNQEVPNKLTSPLTNFEFFLFRASDLRSATIEMRHDSAFMCEYRIDPVGTYSPQEGYTPCSNTLPTLLVSENLANLEPTTKLSIHLKIQIGSKEHRFSFSESNRICLDLNQTPSVELDQTSGIGNVKCVDLKTKLPDEPSRKPLCSSPREPSSASVDDLHVAVKGLFAGRTRDGSSIFKFSKDDLTSNKISVSVRNNLTVFSSQLEVKPLPSSLKIRDSKNTLKEFRFNQNVQTSNTDTISIEKNSMTLSLFDQAFINTKNPASLSVTLNDPVTINEKTCFSDGSIEEFEVSEKVFGGFSTYKFMLVSVRSHSEIDSPNAIEFVNLSHLRFNFIL